jgi:hypothetical protein
MGLSVNAEDLVLRVLRDRAAQLGWACCLQTRLGHAPASHAWKRLSTALRWRPAGRHPRPTAVLCGSAGPPLLRD